MKRLLIYLLILGVVVAAPVKPLEAGKLRPVQAVSIYKEGESVVIETDTKDRGIGDTAEIALQDMRQTSLGIIYLDTAKYLLFTEDAMDAADALRAQFRKTIRVCLEANPVKLDEVTRYLDAHGGLPALKCWKTGEKLPILSTCEDSYKFLKKVEKRA